MTPLHTSDAPEHSAAETASSLSEALGRCRGQLCLVTHCAQLAVGLQCRILAQAPLYRVQVLPLLPADVHSDVLDDPCYSTVPFKVTWSALGVGWKRTRKLVVFNDFAMICYAY